MLKKQQLYWLIFIFIFINIIAKLFFIEIYRVNGNSMKNTLLDGDYVFVIKSQYGIRIPKSIFEIPWVNNILYYILPVNIIETSITSRNGYKVIMKHHTPQKGDIIVFNIPPYQKYINIKRIKNSIYQKYTLKDPYIKTPCIPYKNMAITSGTLTDNYNKLTITYGENIVYTQNKIKIFKHNYFFVMGDNISESTDSRDWGLLQDDHIIGKASLILISFDENKHIRLDRILKRIK